MMIPMWSLEHRQTSMRLADQRGTEKHAANEAIKKKPTPVLGKGTVARQDGIKCVVQCPEEAVWEIKVNETTCGGVKHISSGSELEIQVKLQLHAQPKQKQENN